MTIKERLEAYGSKAKKCLMRRVREAGIDLPEYIFDYSIYAKAAYWDVPETGGELCIEICGRIELAPEDLVKLYRMDNIYWFCIKIEHFNKPAGKFEVGLSRLYYYPHEDRIWGM